VSYDLQIYAARAMPTEEIRTLLATAGLTVEHAAPATDSMIVLRGAKQSYSFTLSFPVIIEPEDVPEVVTAAALGASHFYELFVEGSSSTEIPHATKFARRLADAASGVVLDRQTGQVWSRGKLRQAPPVNTGVVTTIQVRWYVHSASDNGKAAEAWLSTARRHMPEALPRRYGTYEPLQHRLDNGGDDSFIIFVRGADGSVFFSPNKPAVSGSLVGGTTAGGTVECHGLTLLAEPFADERWRMALQHLFLDFAEMIQAVLATAEVVRGVRWSGRGLGYDGNTERTTYLAQRGRWSGLPPYPVWWAWFSSDYATLVRDHLPTDQVEERGHALFHWRADAPVDRDQLFAAATFSSDRRARLFRRGTSASPWLPAELLPVEDRSDPRIFNPPLTPAVVRPASLS
jgi:hypothetical protein